MAKSIDIPREHKAELDNNPIINVIRTFEKHPSNREIKSYAHPNPVFSFDYATKEEVNKEIRLANESKASQEKDTLVKIIKGNYRFA